MSQEPLPLLMLDLCSGFGGASSPMTPPLWRVVRVDLDPRVSPDVVADVRHLPLGSVQLDLLWASPPCTFYSRHSQKGLYPDEPEPDHSLYLAVRRVIDDLQPRFWIIENVRGAVPFWGRPTYRFGPYCLWTNLLLTVIPSGPWTPKANLCRGQDPLHGTKRGRIPFSISACVAESVQVWSGL